MKRFLSVILSAVLLLTAFIPCVYAKNDSASLKFDENGKFKIMLIADTHYTDQVYDECTEFFNLVLDDEKPDLVVFMGDNVKGYWVGSTPMSVKSAISRLVEPVAKRNIPYTAIYGNHDYQTLVAKSLQTKYFNMYDSCIMENGYTYLHRKANCSYLIKDSKGEKDIYNLITLDSGTKDAEEKLMPVLTQQIDWYKETVSSLKEKNGGEVIPSIVFQHIPIYEVEKLFEKSDETNENAVKCSAIANPGYYVLKDGVDGELRGSPKVPYTNTGEYDAFAQMGDVKGVFFAHDHKNTYCGTTDDGIMLGAVPTSGFQSSGDNDLRGVRIIELDENDLNKIETRCVFYEDYKDEDVSWKGGNYPEQKKDYDTSLRFSMIWEYFLYLFK